MMAGFEVTFEEHHFRLISDFCQASKFCTVEPDLFDPVLYVYSPAELEEITKFARSHKVPLRVSERGKE